MDNAPTNYATMKTGRFNSTDIELLEKVLNLDPDLAVVVEIGVVSENG